MRMCVYAYVCIRKTIEYVMQSTGALFEIDLILFNITLQDKLSNTFDL